MPQFHSTQFGLLEYEEAAVVVFPAGLPAFEGETRFLLVEESSRPVAFLQSLATPALVFLCLPACFVDPAFQMELSGEDRQLLGLEPEGKLREGADLLSLVLLTVREGSEVTANLLAPVVIGARTRRALQVILVDSGYRVDHPLQGATATCS